MNEATEGKQKRAKAEKNIDALEALMAKQRDLEEQIKMERKRIAEREKAAQEKRGRVIADMVIKAGITGLSDEVLAREFAAIAARCGTS